jgi:hypothetical protein
MKVVDFMYKPFFTPDKKGEGYVGKAGGKIILPPVQKEGDYLCINPIEKEKYFIAKEKYKVIKRERIFGQEVAHKEYEQFLAQNNLTWDEFHSLPKDTLFNLKGYKIPFKMIEEGGKGVFISDKIFVGSVRAGLFWGGSDLLIDVYFIK